MSPMIFLPPPHTQKNINKPNLVRVSCWYLIFKVTKNWNSHTQSKGHRYQSVTSILHIIQKEVRQAWGVAFHTAGQELTSRLRDSTLISGPEWNWIYQAPRLVFPTIYLFIYVYEYTVAVFRHTRRGHQIPLHMVVSHHVVAGNWTQNLWKSSQCS